MSLPARTTHGTPDGVRAVSRLAPINMELLTEFRPFTAELPTEHECARVIASLRSAASGLTRSVAARRRLPLPADEDTLRREHQSVPEPQGVRRTLSVWAHIAPKRFTACSRT